MTERTPAGNRSSRKAAAPRFSPPALLLAAAQARSQAHCPYSGFHVGAALLSDDGRIFTGCNVENASYGLTICAERSAVFAAVANGTRQFRAMAIVADGAAMPYPCGACRQVLAEFCAARFPVYVASHDDLRAFESLRLGDLLPRTFRLVKKCGAPPATRKPTRKPRNPAKRKPGPPETA